MCDSVQLRWIAEAEARWVRDFALRQRGASEPRLCIVFTVNSPGWFDRLLEAIPRLARRVAGRPPLPGGTPLAITPDFGEARAISRLEEEEEVDRALVTVLFTDIVDSTKRAVELGDARWRALLDRHDQATRYQIGRFGGSEVKNLGDGFLAIFDSPARAVRCASAIAETVAPLGIAIRGGLHTGEIELKRDDIGGVAVHIAARIAALAPPGEAFASRTVRDLVSGSGLVFEDRGVHALRGLPEEIQLYAILAANDPTTSAYLG